MTESQDTPGLSFRLRSIQTVRTCQHQLMETEMLHLGDVVAIWVQGEREMSVSFARLWRHHAANFGIAQILLGVEMGFNRRETV